jgi:hypothetical protein
VATIKNVGLYPDGQGLYLQVSPNSAKSWIYRYRASWTKGNRDIRRDMGRLLHKRGGS